VNAIDPETNELLHVVPNTAQNLGVSLLFFETSQRNTNISDAVFLVDGVPWLQTPLRRHGLRFQHETPGNRKRVTPYCTSRSRVLSGILMESPS
jgi:putative transposase